MVKTPAATGKRKAGTAAAVAQGDAAATAAAVASIENDNQIISVVDEFSPPMAKRLRSAKKARKPRRSLSVERTTTVIPMDAVDVAIENGMHDDSIANDNHNSTMNDQMEEDDPTTDEDDDQQDGEEVQDETLMPSTNYNNNYVDQQPETEKQFTTLQDIDITNQVMEEEMVMAADDVPNEAMEEVAAATVNALKPETKVAADIMEHDPIEPPLDRTDATTSTIDASTAPIDTQGKKNISPIAKLRMPSQHTPGKLSSVVGQDNYEMNPTFMLPHQRLRNLSQQKEEDHHTSMTTDGQPVINLNRVTNNERPAVHDEMDEIMVTPPTDMMTSTAQQQWWHKTLGQFQEILTTMVMKAPPLQQPDNHDGVEVEHATPSAKPWTCSMWFLSLFILQLVIMMSSMQHLYPSMDALVVSTIQQYKVEEPEIVENVTYEQLPNEIVTVTRTKPPPPLEPEQLDLRRTVDTLEHQVNAVDTSFADFTNLQSTLTRRLETIRPTLEQHQASLDAWEKSLDDAEHEIDQLLSHDNKDIPQLVHRGRVALAAMTAPYTATVPLMSIASIPKWTVAPPVKIECPTRVVVPATGEDALVTQEQMEQAEKTIVAMVAESVEAVKNSISGMAKSWIQQIIGSIAKQHSHLLGTAQTLVQQIVGSVSGLSEADVMSTIMDMLELDLADRTGVIDYASVYAGAKIIRRGSRATSPSLVDTLPLFNKLLRATKLRFYGYGPEAALTPTKPWNALGQCWSFSDMTKNKKRKWKNAHRIDNTNGKYATLTIRLAQPIAIGSIVLEHTLQMTGQQHQDVVVAQSSRSAPKDVRVFGYMDPDASGRPFPLGEFAFDITAQSLQTFNITEMSNVKLQSVTLALDSNHGNDYTCLYRFRVHAVQQK